jgi:hypothetical protein
MIFWGTVGIQLLYPKTIVLTSSLTISKMENPILKDKLKKRLKNSTLKDNTPLGLKTTNLKKISRIHPLVFMEVQLTSILIELMYEPLFI